VPFTVRASNDHSFIMGVSQARKGTWQRPPPSSCDELNFPPLACLKYLESQGKTIPYYSLQNTESFDTIRKGGYSMFLYDLFMAWIVGSITVVAASMVLGGLLCVWCAYKGRKRARLESNYAQPSHPSTH